MKLADALQPPQIGFSCQQQFGSQIRAPLLQSATPISFRSGYSTTHGTNDFHDSYRPIMEKGKSINLLGFRFRV
jgi:hypothetical protein